MLESTISDRELDPKGIETDDEFGRKCLKFRPELLAYAKLLCRKRPSDAEDLVQTTLATAMAKQHQLDFDANIRQWLYRILRNFFLDHIGSGFSKRTIFPQNLSKMAGKDFPEHEHRDDKEIEAIDIEILNFRIKYQNVMADDPGIKEVDIDNWAQELMRKHFSRVLFETYQKIKPTYRIVFILVHILNFSYDEAAAILRIPRTTVANRIFRTRNAFCENSKIYALGIEMGLRGDRRKAKQ